jgi:hypothetical protein
MATQPHFCMPRQLLSMLQSAGMAKKDASGKNSSSSRQASFTHSGVHRAAPALLEAPH